MDYLKAQLTELYTAHTRRATRFRYGLILFDAATILFFISTVHLEDSPTLMLCTRLIGIVILLDLMARIWVAEDRRFLLTRVYTIADIIVLATLFVDPLLTGNFAFLRVLRGLRLIHSYHLLYDLRKDSRWFRSHEDLVIACINLFVFLAITASITLIYFIDETATDTPYVDALYFTVATLTTTGYGDITLSSPMGKLFSVFVMVVGVALFVRLAQTIFRPRKVRVPCKDCGLQRHDRDAVHCKHCGTVVSIKTDGG